MGDLTDRWNAKMDYDLAHYPGPGGDAPQPRGMTTADTAAIEAKAREHYEASRKRVSGRPAWERLNPADPYDMGMRETAISRARKDLGFI